MKAKKILLTSLLLGLTFTLSGCNWVNYTPKTESSGYIDELYDFLKEHYYLEVNDRKLLDGLIYGLTNAFNDPFTYYTSSANGETQDYSSSGVGLGFSRSLYYGEAYVSDVMKNSPAEKAGMKESDVITKTREVNSDGTYGEFYVLKDHDYNDWTNYFTGEENSKIEIYIKRKDTNGNYQDLNTPLLVTRGKYNVDKTKLIEFTNTNGYSEAYVELSSFLGDKQNNETTPQEELKDIFDKDIFSKVNNLDHLIIDLRGNGGGYVDNCVSALGLFIPKGEVTAYYQYANGSYQALKNETYDVQYTDKINQITLIVDNNTASAGESFAVGLRDSEYTKNKVNIVGQVSYGKGIAQTFISLFNDGSLVRYTFARVCSPSKECINKRGIVPDLFLGEENIPYDKYVRFINGVKSNDELNEHDQNILINRINILTGKSNSNLEEAIKSLISQYKLEDSNGIYTSNIANSLSDLFYDNYLIHYGSSIYTGHVNGVNNNDYLSSAQRIFIKEKINYLMNSSYQSFDQAIKAFQQKYAIENEEHIYDKTSADLLQGLVMDLHLNNYNVEVINQIKEAYGSKKI